MLALRRTLPALWTLLLASGPYALLLVPDRRAALYDALLFLPYAASGLLALLAARLNERRAFAAALSLGITYACFRWAPNTVQGGFWAAAAAAAYPTSIALLYVVPSAFTERGAWLRSVTVSLLPFAAAAVALRYAPNGAIEIFGAAAGGIARELAVPRLAFAAALAAPMSVLFVTDRFQRDFGMFAAACSFPVCLAAVQIAGTGGNEAAATSFLSATAVLAYGTFRLYWHKIYWDELTGIPNRRALNERMLHLRRRYVIAMVDIDRFKTFNDTFGHDEGDHVLRFVAKHFESETRGNAYRYGGEEFCVILENTAAEDAGKRLEAIRKKLSDRSFTVRTPMRARTTAKDRTKPSPKGEKVHVTVSIGIAAGGATLTRPDDVVIAADSALYRAKDLGRDRVLLAQVESVPEKKRAGKN